MVDGVFVIPTFTGIQKPLTLNKLDSRLKISGMTGKEAVQAADRVVLGEVDAKVEAEVPFPQPDVHFRGLLGLEGEKVRQWLEEKGSGTA